LQKSLIGGLQEDVNEKIAKKNSQEKYLAKIIDYGVGVFEGCVVEVS
jgi:hypothetical protein